MTADVQKIRPDHLRRDAYLYVRQSTPRQAVENTERQHALRERAVAPGRPRKRVVVIDADRGQSGADGDREGFQRLVAAVGPGRGGIVLGLEVSRLARNSSDWHQPLEICALTRAPILDEDGLYDPLQFNDRLVLGLEGPMSEAGLHILGARLRGGILSKARRGERRGPLPVGPAYDERGQVVLDPDRQVREAPARLFATFQRTGSASATVEHFRREGWLFPRRARGGPKRGAWLWGPLGQCRAPRTPHNPRSAGAYCFGRSRVRRTAHGTTAAAKLPQEEWLVLWREAFTGHSTWPQFQDDQRRLRENARAHGCGRSYGPPGQGPALPQGVAVCGACGERLTVRYHRRRERLVPTCVCQRRGIEAGTPPCRVVPGQPVEAAVEGLVPEHLRPAAVKLTPAIQAELEAHGEEADRLRGLQVERLRYEAEPARRRYQHADPANRLVAQALEADWNDKLRAVRAAEEYQRRQQARLELDEQTRHDRQALSTDFRRVWHDPKTLPQDRKRLIRLILEEVMIRRQAGGPAVQVRFRGGTTQCVQTGVPKNAWELRQTSREVIRQIDKLLGHGADGQVAEQLNALGLTLGAGGKFTGRRVQWLRQPHGARSRRARLRAAGYLTPEAVAAELGVSKGTVGTWRRHGLLRAVRHSDKGEWLYEPPGADRPRKQQGHKLAERRGALPVAADRPNEVYADA